LLSQHTPSTQEPLAHSALAVQVVPERLVHTPLVNPALHDLPAPQEPTAQQTPSVQKPLVQVDALVHVVPSPSMGMHAPDLQ
jgi:hypothetical protein